MLHAVQGGGQGTFQSSCHILHYHMVLRPKGTSHNEVTLYLCFQLLDWLLTMRTTAALDTSEDLKTVYTGMFAEKLWQSYCRQH